ncbi:hypothetical protein CPB83DRAFT_774687, partial [Crepidotus variabilis]
ARNISVDTREMRKQMPHTRCALPESFFADSAIQPYIHNCIVTVHYRRRINRFMIFFKQHLKLQQNIAIQQLLGRPPVLRGDAVVMRVGKVHPYVHMRGRDGRLMDRILKRCVKFLRYQLL